MSFTTRFQNLAFILLGTFLCSSAQNSPKDFLNAHNVARAKVGVGPMIWDKAVASYAEAYAKSRNGSCNLVHSGGPYGENLAMGSSDDFSGVDAVNLWVNEKQYYDYESNTCAEGQVCLHYIRVIWSNSTGLGCARTPCDEGGWYVICSYNPPGNYIGERPYYKYNSLTYLAFMCDGTVSV